MSAMLIHAGPCVCSVPGCGREWPRDPMLEVPCPDCKAPIGVRCKRPSGHSGPLIVGHRSRDLAADGAGAYGRCPLGRCGVANITSTSATADTSDGAGRRRMPAAEQGRLPF